MFGFVISRVISHTDFFFNLIILKIISALKMIVYNQIKILHLPIDVKKFIENLVLAGSSLGKSPSNASDIVGSRIRARNFDKPMYSTSS